MPGTVPGSLPGTLPRNMDIEKDYGDNKTEGQYNLIRSALLIQSMIQRLRQNTKHTTAKLIELHSAQDMHGRRQI